MAERGGIRAQRGQWRAGRLPREAATHDV